VLICHLVCKVGLQELAMNKYLAELIGTAALVFFGCGSAVVAGFGPILGTAPYGVLAVLQIALAFGLTVTVMAYAIGPVSGCHVNPAVSVGAFIARRLSAIDLVGYIVSQCVGAFIGAGLLALILKGKVEGYDIATAGLGQNAWDPAKWSTSSAFLIEAVATFFFLTVILGSTQSRTATPVAGLAIGLSLAVIHIVLIPVTGTSVNPARSLAPAVFVGGLPLQELWLFIVAPTVGAIVAGLVFRLNLLFSEQ
jgi:aquaporin Z